MRSLKSQEYWHRAAVLGGRRAVLDPNDTLGGKNDFIHEVSRAALVRAVRSLGSPRFGVAVDFGCGVGRLVPTLRGLADEIVGVDPVEPMLEIARQAYGTDRVRFMTPDELPETLAQPLLVVSAYVLADNHDFDAAVDALGRLRQLAAPGSVCVLLDRVSASREPQRTDGESWPLDWYLEALEHAGWRPGPVRRIRRSSSLQLRLAARVAPHLHRRVRRIAVWAAARLELAIAPHARTSGDYFEACITATA